MDELEPAIAAFKTPIHPIERREILKQFLFILMFFVHKGATFLLLVGTSIISVGLKFKFSMLRWVT